jgi:serine-type D-Ala-D-Ala carboxypeptidase/endopeptidase (penicillin-binding protein 4)
MRFLSIERRKVVKMTHLTPSQYQFVKINMPKIVFIAFFLASQMCAVTAIAQTQQNRKLPDVVINMLRAAQIPEDALAIQVVRLSDGAIVAAHNTDAGMQPASTIKLLTTLVSLERLGPTYRGRTEMVTSGRIIGDALVGDVALRGLGDADLDWRALQTMLRTLRSQGIREIRGDLVIDRELFQPSRPDIGAPQFDDEPEFRYNVIPDALLLNMNLHDVSFRSGADSLAVEMSPTLDGVSVVNKMTLINAACNKWEDGWKSPTVERSADGNIRITLNGTFPKNCVASTELNLLDRREYAERLFRALWREMGGTFSGAVREAATDSAGMRVLAQHRSRPLAEVIRDINKSSDNTLARLLYLTLGTLPTTENNFTTQARADQEVRAWLKRHAINDNGLVLENGSGLSRTECISPSQMIALLTIGARSNWAPEFMASLPIAALDGTLRRRLRESPAAQRARLKTGTLKNVVAVAGYVHDGTNELCATVAFINHPLAVSSVAQPILDALTDWITRSKTESAWALPLSAYAGG